MVLENTKEKKYRKIIFFMFGFVMENAKESKI